jgi:hypothetical protein
MLKCFPDIIFRPKHLTSHLVYVIMAGVLRRLFGPQRKLVQDRRVMELQAAKEILAEVFRVRLSEVDEMIQNRFEDASSQECCQEEVGPWPQEFRLDE